jgi:mono/diheme cytochrome c family protein
MRELRALLKAIVASCSALLLAFSFARGLRATVSARELAAPVATAPQIELTGEAGQGRHLFLVNCAHCHGDDARGDEGPDLHNVHKSDERIHQIVTGGIKGEMPSFGTKLDDGDIRALTAYLRTLHG